MLLNLKKIFQSNFPHRSILSLSNAIIGASVLSMGYCFQQVDSLGMLNRWIISFVDRSVALF